MANTGTPTKGAQYKVLIYEGNTATHHAIINAERAISFNPNFDEPELPDLDDQMAPASVYPMVRSVQVEITGGGQTHGSDTGFWTQWALNPTPKKVDFVRVDAVNGYKVSGNAVCASFDITGERSSFTTSNITLRSYGPMVSSNTVTTS